MTTPRCALSASEGGEPLFGTAPHAPAWLFLEYAGPWEARALAESDLPDPVKTFLQRLRKETGARISFIRRERETPPPWRLLLWRPDPQGERCARWELPTLETLLDLPLTAWLRGTQALPDETLCREPIFLVCVNARRDACCGHFGPSLYRALKRLQPDRVWMTTHIGGHRFAPTCIEMPHGLVYGRVHTPEEAAAMAQATARGEVHLGLLRGRIGLPRPAQAAEHFLRQATGERRITAFHLAQMHEEAPQQWRVTFLAEDQAHTITLTQRTSPLRRSTSCGAAPKPMHLFHLLAIEDHPVRRYRAAGGVVFDPREGKVLVLLRPSRREVRLPKGHIEPGEGPWATAQREIAEEAGLPQEALHLMADLGETPVGFFHEGHFVWRHERYFLVRWEGGPLTSGEPQFIPLWLPWSQAEVALTYPAEQAWLRRAWEAYRHLKEESRK